MAKRTPERIEFLSDILTTAVEGGINDWAEVLAYYPSKNLASITEVDESEVHAINIDTIAHGISVISSWKKEKGFEPNYFGDGGAYWREFLKANDSNGEDGDYDATIADWIVQAGLFGEIIYG